MSAIWAHVEARDQHRIPLIITFQTYVLIQGLLLNLNLVLLVRFVGP